MMFIEEFEVSDTDGHDHVIMTKLISEDGVRIYTEIYAIDLDKVVTEVTIVSKNKYYNKRRGAKIRTDATTSKTLGALGFLDETY